MTSLRSLENRHPRQIPARKKSEHTIPRSLLEKALCCREKSELELSIPNHENLIDRQPRKARNAITDVLAVMRRKNCQQQSLLSTFPNHMQTQQHRTPGNMPRCEMAKLPLHNSNSGWISERTAAGCCDHGADAGPRCFP